MPASCTYDPKSESGRRFRRIADHVRACTFAVHENVYPGAKAEKYVIRRLLRRAVLDGRQLGVEEPFLYRLVPVVVEMMAGPYPELRDTVERVSQVIQQEEQSFFATIDAGLARVEGIFAAMAQDGRVLVDGNDAAELYSTYGIPPELVESLAAERNYTFDTEGFRKAMIKHGLDSGKQQIELFKTGPIEALKKAIHLTRFLGYEMESSPAEIKGIIAQHQLCDRVNEVGHAQPITVVLDQTPFYGESGGQVGDVGEIVGEGFRFRVSDTQKDGDLILHVGHLIEGEMRAGATVTARVDAAHRGGDPPGPFGDAHPALRAAEEPGPPRPAARFQSRSRLAAIRLHEPLGSGRRSAAANRTRRAGPHSGRRTGGLGLRPAWPRRARRGP